MIHQLEKYLSSTISTSGTLTKSQANANSILNDFSDDLSDIDDKVTVLKKDIHHNLVLWKVLLPT